jgi:isopentenyldiphosphate isomerase
MIDEDELLDLVDDSDNVIGTILRAEAHAKDLYNVRAIHAFVKNSRGQLWIARRAKYKKVAPLALDASVSGHVNSGESYEQGLIRETMEEIGLDLNKLAFKELAYLSRIEHKVYCFEKVYEINFDGEPKYNRSEISEGYWLSLAEIKRRIKRGDNFKSDVPKIIETVYGKLTTK